MGVTLFDPQGIAACETREADLIVDAEAVEAVWGRNYPNGPGHRVPLYGDHPDGRGHIFVLQDREARIVGAAGLHVRSLVMDGRQVRAACVGNVAVDEAHRTAASIVKLLRAMAQSEAAAGCAFVLGVTTKLVPFLTRIGFRRVGLMQRWTKPLRCHGYLQRRLASRWAADALAPPGDLLLWLRDLSPGGRDIAGPVPALPDSTDELWSLRGPRALSFCRSAEVLNHQFASGGRHRLFALHNRAGTLKAWLAWEFSGEAIQVVDFLARCPDDLRQILREFTRWLRRAHPRAVAIHLCQLGAPENVPVLRGLGFRPRKDGDQALLRPSPALDARQAAALFEEHRWFLTEVDSGL